MSEKIGPFPSAYKQHGGKDSWVRPDGRHPDFIIRDFFKGSDWEERIELEEQRDRYYRLVSTLERDNRALVETLERIATISKTHGEFEADLDEAIRLARASLDHIQERR